MENEDNSDSNQEESNEAFDMRILTGLFQGDSHVWFEFYDHYKGRLESFFEKRDVYDEKDREDLFQETMAAIFSSLPDYDPERAPFRNWVYGVATNVMLRAQRDYSHRYKMEDTGDAALSEASLAAGDPFDDSAGNVDDPRLTRLREAMSSLSDKDREILILHESRTATWDELAEELEIGISAAKMRYKRALVRLRDAYLGLSS